MMDMHTIIHEIFVFKICDQICEKGHINLYDFEEP